MGSFITLESSAKIKRKLKSIEVKEMWTQTYEVNKHMKRVFKVSILSCNLL